MNPRPEIGGFGSIVRVCGMRGRALDCPGVPFKGSLACPARGLPPVFRVGRVALGGWGSGVDMKGSWCGVWGEGFGVWGIVMY